MAEQDIGQCLDAQVARVLFIRRPRGHRHARDDVDNLLVVAESQLGPLIEQTLSRLLRVPRELAVGVQVGHGEVAAEPRRVGADVDHARVAAQLAREPLAADNVRRGRPLAVGAEVKVEDLLPHGRQVHQMRLLAEVLLRDLQLDGGARLDQVREER